MEEFYLGIDIGGTSVKIGLFDKNINFLEKWTLPTDLKENGKNILPQTAEFVKAKTNNLNIKAVGIGVPGPVNDKGTANECVNLSWGKTDVKNIFESLTGFNTTVLNDANAAALGELSENCKNMVFVTVGTGVGGGIVENGKIINGFNGSAGEIGHIKVNPYETEKCGCGKCGCVEQYASATGMKKYAEKLISEGMKTSLEENFEAKDIVEKAAKGDELCLKVVDFMAFNPALALSAVSCCVNPEKIIIGGGVSKGGETILYPIRKYYKKFAFPSAENTEIVVAKIGNDAGMMGAAKAAKAFL